LTSDVQDYQFGMDIMSSNKCLSKDDNYLVFINHVAQLCRPLFNYHNSTICFYWNCKCLSISQLSSEF